MTTAEGSDYLKLLTSERLKDKVGVQSACVIVYLVLLWLSGMNYIRSIAETEL